MGWWGQKTGHNSRFELAIRSAVRLTRPASARVENLMTRILLVRVGAGLNARRHFSLRRTFAGRICRASISAAGPTPHFLNAAGVRSRRVSVITATMAHAREVCVLGRFPRRHVSHRSGRPARVLTARAALFCGMTVTTTENRAAQSEIVSICCKLRYFRLPSNA